jgi:hypothetical protein
MNSDSPGTGANFPVFQSLLDPFPARGYEIPQNVAWALQCRAAEKHHSRGVRCPHRDTAARMKDQKPRPPECLARDLDLSLDDINRHGAASSIKGLDSMIRLTGRMDMVC